MNYHIQRLDPLHPVTIGWSNSESAEILSDDVDFVTFHYYESLDDLEHNLVKLKTNVNDKTVMLGEFGLSSYNGFWNPFGADEKDQAEYHKKAQEIITRNKLSFMSWTLYDFEDIPNKVAGRRPWRKNAQKHFGFINSDGEKKPSFEYLTRPKS